VAEVRENPFLEGLSGRVGEFVFRIRDGRTFVARRPARRRSATTTEPRGRTLSRFKEAVAFAREARHKPAFRSLSRVLRGYSPYHLAIQDYLSLPLIEKVDDQDVTGQGGVLVIDVSEKIDVRSVEVRLLEAGGEGVTSKITAPAAGQTGVQPAATEPGRRVTVIRAERVLGARRTLRREVRPASAAGSAGTPAATEAARGSGPASAPSTPAEIFFRQPPTGAAQASKTGPGHAADAGAAAEPGAAETPQGFRSPDEAGSHTRRDEQRAERHGEAEDAGERPPLTVTTWRLVLPRPGEVEIRASDYAGNEAKLQRWVGPAGQPGLFESGASRG
jgi:hypothetical protein